MALVYLEIWVLILQFRVLKPQLQPICALHLIQFLAHRFQACPISITARHRNGLYVGQGHEMQTERRGS